MKPEFDRYGRASACSGSQAATIIRLPQIKKIPFAWVPLDPLFLKGRREGPTGL